MRWSSGDNLVGAIDSCKRLLSPQTPLTHLKIVLADILWTGGDSVLVQCGDILDRGSFECACFHLLSILSAQARDHGGGKSSWGEGQRGGKSVESGKSRRRTDVPPDFFSP
jgi:hypothetical protein